MRKLMMVCLFLAPLAANAQAADPIVAARAAHIAALQAYIAANDKNAAVDAQIAALVKQRIPDDPLIEARQELRMLEGFTRRPVAAPRPATPAGAPVRGATP